MHPCPACGSQHSSPLAAAQCCDPPLVECATCHTPYPSPAAADACCRD